MNEQDEIKNKILFELNCLNGDKTANIQDYYYTIKEMFLNMFADDCPNFNNCGQSYMENRSAY